MQSYIATCEKGHTKKISDLGEIYNEFTFDYECFECLAIGEITNVNLTCPHCAEGKHWLCPEEDLLECSCKCNEDPDYVLQLIAELEKDVEF